MLKNKLWFRNICNKNGLYVSDTQAYLVEQYVNLLLYWNKKINLISRRSEENIWTHQIVSSISFLFKYRFNNKANIIDVGTGGGLPGIPLSILCQDNYFTLIDSILKKINVVKEIVKELNLKNVSVACGRAENLSKQKEYQHKFDYVIARAVAPTKNLITWCSPFLTLKSIILDNTEKPVIPNSTLLLLKGGDITKEINDAKLKHRLKDIDIIPLSINGLNPNDLFDKKLVIIKP